mgnify:FL=1
MIAQRRYRDTGWTPEQYDETSKLQNGKCAICGQEETRKLHGKVVTLCADHCHATGKKRGLLCQKCNMAIGLFNDSQRLIIKACNYLEQYLE